MSPSLPSPGRLLLSQLTPVSKSSPVDNDRVYKNPFYSPTFLPFLARQVHLSLPLPPPLPPVSRLRPTVESRDFLFSKKSYEPILRNVSKDWRIRSESVSEERESVLSGMRVRVCCRVKQPGGLTLRLKKSASGKLLLPLFCSRLLLLLLRPLSFAGHLRF